MLDHLIRKGDRVRMKMDTEDRHYHKAVKNGTLGTVIGRRRIYGLIERRYPRSLYREPGVYARDTHPIVVWDKYPEGVDPNDTDYPHVEGIFLEPADSFLEEYELRRKTEWPVRHPNGETNIAFCTIKNGDLLSNMERTGDLPETAFWELDIVSWKNRRYRVLSVDYFRWGPGKQHCYRIEEVDDNNVYLRNGSLTCDPDQLSLIERGNVWREFHGEPTRFHSFEEETSFEINMGRSTAVRNLSDNRYVWTLEQVLEAIDKDIVDGFFLEKSFFISEKHISALRFTNREFGERMRQKVIEGFSSKTPVTQ